MTARASSIRVNPEITLDAPHDYIKTGGQGAQVRHSVRRRRARRAARDVAPERRAASGSTCTSGRSSRASIRIARARSAWRRSSPSWRKRGIDTLDYLDIGGGLGVRYDTEQPPDLRRFAELVLPTVAATGLKLIMEPGRFIVGNAGVLLDTCALPEAQRRQGLRDRRRRDDRAASSVALRRVSPRRSRCAQRGDASDAWTSSGRCARAATSSRSTANWTTCSRATVSWSCDVGAYGYAMASNYNSRAAPAEVLVDGDRFAVITRARAVRRSRRGWRSTHRTGGAREKR